jgi:hypothetical protein
MLPSSLLDCALVILHVLHERRHLIHPHRLDFTRAESEEMTDARQRF